MKWKLKKFLLRAFIGLLAIYIATTTVRAFINPIQPIKIIKSNQEITDKKYIISEQMIMSKLKSKSQIVSLEQSLHKKDIYVDKNWAGERDTELTVNGAYKLGLETKDIEIKHIDSQNGIIYIALGEPILISLDIPFDHIKFSKSMGFFRLAMDEDEQRNFYKATEKNIERELMNDKELQKQADLHNRDAVMNLLKLIPEIKSVIFQ